MIHVYPRFCIGSGKAMGKDGLVYQHRVLNADLVVRQEFKHLQFLLSLLSEALISDVHIWKGASCNLRH